MVFPNSRTGCSRVPPQSATLTPQYCYLGDPVRLACLIHAASVRSEPESNSQKKKVFSLKFPRENFGSSHKHYCFLQYRLSKITRSPFRANEDIVYQIFFQRARGYFNFFKKNLSPSTLRAKKQQNIFIV